MTADKPYLHQGAMFSDNRGQMAFCNDFDMQPVKRMYIIAPASTAIIRAWQGHQHEAKWFFCLEGSFDVKLVAIDNFTNPGVNLPVFSYQLRAIDPQVLYIPGGYANGFKANQESSKLLVYSNNSVAESQSDDFRYPADQWDLWKK
jgi:dTDP-4-dehydrorhamnose 3,5-epimerase-like enzyme